MQILDCARLFCSDLAFCVSFMSSFCEWKELLLDVIYTTLYHFIIWGGLQGDDKSDLLKVNNTFVEKRKKTL